MLPGTWLQMFFLQLVFQIMMISLHQHTIEACEENVIMACIDNTTCTQTYGEVYNALASQQNYYNIAQALYPAKRPSSVLVHVKLFGANGTGNCTPAEYTWSMLCLYAAFPAYVLEVLSLGSIIVNSRTQELNITIPPFCCNVSKNDRMSMIDRVLVALQDLAVIPMIQDPRLNTVECVIEGHEPNIQDTVRGAYVITAMWLSCIFTFFFGPWLAIIFTLIFSEKVPAMFKAVKRVSCLMLAAEVALFIAAIVLSVCGNAPWHIYPILVVILLEGLVLGVTLTDKCFSGNKLLPEGKLMQISIFMWANLTAYHFCWLVIGIMSNALWGVTVLLFVCLVIAVAIFAVYNYYYNSIDDFICSNFILCTAGFLSVGSLVAVVIVAGQSAFGRDTTDDVVKTVSLSVVTACISWILSTMKKDDKSEESKGKKETKKKEEEECVPLNEIVPE